MQRPKEGDLACRTPCGARARLHGACASRTEPGAQKRRGGARPTRACRARGVGGVGWQSTTAADWGPGLARGCDHAQSPRAWAVCTRRSQATKSGADAGHASQRITGLRQQLKVAYPDARPFALRTDAALMARLRNERALEESVCACSSYAQCVACRRRDGRALRTAASSDTTSAGR